MRDTMPAQHPRYDGPVVDAHCHFDGAAAGLVRGVLDAAGLDRCVNFWDLSWPPPPYAAWHESWADFRGEMRLCHTPNLEGVGSPAFADDLVEGIQVAHRLGAVAVKVWKNLGLHLTDVDGRRLRINDPRLEPLWSAPGELGLPVVIHIGDPPAFFEPLTPANERYQELLIRPEYWYGGPEYPSLAELHDDFTEVVRSFPDTTFVGLHFGCFMPLAKVAELLFEMPNYYVDTATRISDLGREPPEVVRPLFQRFADRIIFGTDLIRTEKFDLPDGRDNWEDIARFYELHWRYFETEDEGIPLSLAYQGNWTMRGLGLSHAVLERLYHLNARYLFATPSA